MCSDQDSIKLLNINYEDLFVMKTNQKTTINVETNKKKARKKNKTQKRKLEAIEKNNKLLHTESFGNAQNKFIKKTDELKESFSELKKSTSTSSVEIVDDYCLVEHSYYDDELYSFSTYDETNNNVKADEKMLKNKKTVEKKEEILLVEIPSSDDEFIILDEVGNESDNDEQIMKTKNQNIEAKKVKEKFSVNRGFRDELIKDIGNNSDCIIVENKVQNTETNIKKENFLVDTGFKDEFFVIDDTENSSDSMIIENKNQNTETKMEQILVDTSDSDNELIVADEVKRSFIMETDAQNVGANKTKEKSVHTLISEDELIVIDEVKSSFIIESDAQNVGVNKSKEKSVDTLISEDELIVIDEIKSSLIMETDAQNVGANKTKEKSVHTLISEDELIVIDEVKSNLIMETDAQNLGANKTKEKSVHTLISEDELIVIDEVKSNLIMETDAQNLGANKTKEKSVLTLISEDELIVIDEVKSNLIMESDAQNVGANKTKEKSVHTLISEDELIVIDEVKSSLIMESEAQNTYGILKDELIFKDKVKDLDCMIVEKENTLRLKPLMNATQTAIAPCKKVVCPLLSPEYLKIIGDQQLSKSEITNNIDLLTPIIGENSDFIYSADMLWPSVQDDSNVLMTNVVRIKMKEIEIKDEIVRRNMHEELLNERKKKRSSRNVKGGKRSCLYMDLHVLTDVDIELLNKVKSETVNLVLFVEIGTTQKYVNILKNSTQRAGVSMTLKQTTRTWDTNGLKTKARDYSLLINNKVAVEGTFGRNKDIAYEELCAKLYWILKETSFVIQMKRCPDRVKQILKSELGDCPGADVEVSYSAAASRMMRLMGWRGGGLGKAGQGILTPITPALTQRNKAIGLGHRAAPSCSRCPQLKQSLQGLLQEYARGSQDHDLTFGTDFTNEEKDIIIITAENSGLKTKVSKKKKDRSVTVFKVLKPWHLVEHLMANNDETEKYKLLRPGQQ